MRLDKYLKISRLIKRRTVANEACDGGRITVNGKVARASYAIKEGDTISIQMGTRPLTVEVLSVSEYAGSVRQFPNLYQRGLPSPAPWAIFLSGEERNMEKKVARGLAPLNPLFGCATQ